MHTALPLIAAAERRFELASHDASLAGVGAERTQWIDPLISSPEAALQKQFLMQEEEQVEHGYDWASLKPTGER